MRIFIVSIVLLLLSVGFVICMDLLVGLPLSVSLENIISPFTFMTPQELVTVVIFMLYVIVKPINVHLKKQKQATNKTYK
ncbi:hypothetical protein J2T16_000535 [Paenibacillus intestini]|nr:hypothetical protein [Paenibacillus intestini]